MDTTHQAQSAQPIVLIEWPDTPGAIRQAARADQLEMMAEQSERALNRAMGTIHAVSHRIARTMNELGEQVRPDEAEVTFGIKLDAQAGAFLAKASAGAQISVKLKWDIEQPERVKQIVENTNM